MVRSVLTVFTVWHWTENLGKVYCKMFIETSLHLSNEFLIRSSTKHSTEKLRYGSTNCRHIPSFEIFIACDSDSLPFSSDIGYWAAVFQACKRRAINQSHAHVLIANCKVSFQQMSKFSILEHQKYMQANTLSCFQKLNKPHHHHLNV